MSLYPPSHAFAGRELTWHRLAVASRKQTAALAGVTLRLGAS
jgi:hypothetical protein